MEGSVQQLVDSIKGTRDAISVRRVFGDAYELDGVTIIPVASVAGGGGGGAGQGEGPDDSQGSGMGTGFGIHARPVGVYEIRDGNVEWKPTIDASRLARNGQILGGIFLVGLELVLRRRH